MKSEKTNLFISSGILIALIILILINVNNINISLMYDGEGNPISSLDGALDVHDADTHDDLINHYFFKKTGDNTTLNISATAGDRIIYVLNASGFSVGNYLDLLNGTRHIHHWRYITAISGNNITVDAPIDYNFTNGSLVEEGIANMAVDGSNTTQIFQVTTEENETLHILRLLIALEHTLASDDSKFGDQTALTNGVVLRKSIDGGKTFKTETVWRTNKDMKEDMYNVDYTDKAGAGNHATNGRWTIKNAGNIFRVSQNNNELLQILIQDDLTGLIDFQVKVQGHPEK